MFGRGITLFRIFGFAIRADVSWLIILGLVIWSLAAGVFPGELKGRTTGTYVLMGVLGAMGLFLSIIFHELCHSLVARQFNLPIRSITLFVFGGVSEMTEEPQSAKAEFLMAVAGPLSSGLLAAAFLLIAYAGRHGGWPAEVNAVLQWMGYINAVLAIFNLVPGFPLDGGRVLRSILWYTKNDLRWATRVAAMAGSGFGLGFMALGFLNLVMLNPIGGLWWIVIGIFLRSAARQSYQQVVIRQLLQGEPVSKYMNRNPVTVSPSLSVRSLVEDYIYQYHYKMFPVVRDGRLQGCVSTRDVQRVPREEWDNNAVQSIVNQCAANNTIGPNDDAMKALARMNQNGTSRLLVVDDGNLEGILALSDLLKFLSLKLELEGEEAPVVDEGPMQE
jgi:Zn-dependent protease/CBS domain-containing protein